MTDLEQTPFITRGADFVRPDGEPTDFHAPRYEPEAEYTLPWWPFALGSAIVVVAVAVVLS